MKKAIIGLVAALAAGLPIARAADSAPTSLTIDNADVKGNLFVPTAGGRHAAVLVLGGSEGGNAWARSVAAALSAQGYVAFAESYFKAPGLPDKLQEIPLERFRAGIDLLSTRQDVDPARVGVLGLSKGAEAALLIAAHDARIHAVVAGSPADMAFEGIDRSGKSHLGSWSLDGKALPYAPFTACACQSLAELYAKSREADKDAGTQIPVESINGPILLLSSAADQVWPSKTMAEAIDARQHAKGFRFAVRQLEYPQGGHFSLGLVPTPEDAKDDADFGGGTPAGVIAARKDAWPKVLDFLHDSLKPAS